MSPLVTQQRRLAAMHRRLEVARGEESPPEPLVIRLDEIPADLMLAFTADKGWHWAAAPSDAEWAALQA